MKRSKYIILLLVCVVFYMLYTSNQWLKDLSHQPPRYQLEIKTTTHSTLPPIHDTIGLGDLDKTLYDSKVTCSQRHWRINNIY